MLEKIERKMKKAVEKIKDQFITPSPYLSHQTVMQQVRQNLLYELIDGAHKDKRLNDELYTNY